MSNQAGSSSESCDNKSNFGRDDICPDKMAHMIGNKMNRMASTASEYAKNGREYVSDNPVKGVAFAAVTGAVVGSILTMAMRKRN